MGRDGGAGRPQLSSRSARLLLAAGRPPACTQSLSSERTAYMLPANAPRCGHLASTTSAAAPLRRCLHGGELRDRRLHDIRGRLDPVCLVGHHLRAAGTCDAPRSASQPPWAVPRAAPLARAAAATGSDWPQRTTPARAAPRCAAQQGTAPPRRPECTGSGTFHRDHAPAQRALQAQALARLQMPTPKQAVGPAALGSPSGAHLHRDFVICRCRCKAPLQGPLQSGPCRSRQARSQGVQQEHRDQAERTGATVGVPRYRRRCRVGIGNPESENGTRARWLLAYVDLAPLQSPTLMVSQQAACLVRLELCTFERVRPARALAQPLRPRSGPTPF